MSNTICGYNAWLIENMQYKSWYLENYPVLNGEFPIPEYVLKDFYISDMKDRNLKPIDEYKNCYDLLFSYYLAYKDNQGFTAKNLWSRTIGNIIPSLTKSYNDITGTINFYLYFGAGIISLLVILNIVKAIRGK